MVVDDYDGYGYCDWIVAVGVERGDFVERVVECWSSIALKDC